MLEWSLIGTIPHVLGNEALSSIPQTQAFSNLLVRISSQGTKAKANRHDSLNAKSPSVRAAEISPAGKVSRARLPSPWRLQFGKMLMHTLHEAEEARSMSQA